MDRQTVKHIIESPVFELFVKQYEKDLHRQHEYLFEVPSMLKDICKVVFIHNKQKSVQYTSIPKNTIFMDNVDKCLDYLNPIIREETKGFFQQVDATTENNMRHPAFRSAIIAFFYLEGLWAGSLFGKRQFFNSDGTIAKSIPFIGFWDVRVIVQHGKLKAHVNYLANHNKRLRDMVCFTMPVKPDVEEGIYEHSLLLLPQVDLQYRREETDGLNTTVINLRYLHNEYGFKAIGMISRDTADSAGPRIRKRFVLDQPFQITVYHKSEKVFRVAVDNLQ